MRSSTLAFLFGVSAAGLSAQATVLAPEELCAGGASGAIATFASADLESSVRVALGVPGDARLTCEQLAGVEHLDASELGMRSLVGIQNLTGLRRLSLWDAEIANIEPLQSLTTLTYLDLGRNQIRDLQPLSALTRLDTLFLNDNAIEDITPLAGLTRMENLSVTFNSISDLGPIASMRDLTTLRVYGNPITDIGAMRGLTELHELHIHDLTELTDIGPLLENEGLGRGDVMILYNTGVSCAEASALRDKGVTVRSDCVRLLLLEMWPVLAALVAAVVGGVLLIVLLRRRRMPA